MQNNSLRTATLLFSALIAEVMLLSYIVNLVFVPSGSMEPNIRTNSLHLAWALPYAAGIGEQMPERGDIIVFRPEEGPALIKRVIGLPGETLEIRDGRLYIDGTVLLEPYLPCDTATHPGPGQQREYRIPQNCFFVMGDNRDASMDSRYMDDPYIKLSAIQSRLIF